MSQREHWERIYRTNAPTEVSRYQQQAHLSLELIRRSAPDLDASIFDAGRGASTLVDGLLDEGYRRVTVLGLSRTALKLAQQPLGSSNASAARVVEPARGPAT